MSPKHCPSFPGKCDIKSNDNKVFSITLGPKNLDATGPLHVDVKTDSKIEKVVVELLALTHVLPEEIKALKMQNENFYSGDVSLGICTEKLMQWQAKIKIYLEDKNYYTLLRFDVERP